MSEPEPTYTVASTGREVTCPRCEHVFPFLEFELPGARRYLQIGIMMVFHCRLTCPDCQYIWYYNRGQAIDTELNSC